jgi:hypothetical protein
VASESLAVTARAWFDPPASADTLGPPGTLFYAVTVRNAGADTARLWLDGCRGQVLLFRTPARTGPPVTATPVLGSGSGRTRRGDPVPGSAAGPPACEEPARSVVLAPGAARGDTSAFSAGVAFGRLPPDGRYHAAVRYRVDTRRDAAPRLLPAGVSPSRAASAPCASRRGPPWSTSRRRRSRCG